MESQELKNYFKTLLKEAARDVSKSIKDTYINNDLMNIEELIRDLPFETTKSTVYTWVHKGEIPYKKFRGKLLFSREEIKKWINNEMI